MLLEDKDVKNVETDDGEEAFHTQNSITENDDIFADLNPSVGEENTNDTKNEDYLADTEIHTNEVKGQSEVVQEMDDGKHSARSVEKNMASSSADENKIESKIGGQIEVVEEFSENEHSNRPERNEIESETATEEEKETSDKEINENKAITGEDIESASVELSLGIKGSQKSKSLDPFDILTKSDSIDEDKENNDNISLSGSDHSDQHLPQPAQESGESSIRSKKKKSKSKDNDDNVTLSMEFSVASETSSASTEKGTEEQKGTKEEEQFFNRIYYHAMYDDFTEQCQEARKKNTMLHHKVSEYYRKRKMYHVLVQSKVTPDDQKKYDKHLDQATELSKYFEKEQARISKALLYLKMRQAGMEQEAKVLFTKLQNMEQEIGREFEGTDIKGAPKLVERYLKKQRNQLAITIKIRFDYVKLKNRYNEKKTALDALDNLGSNLHLIDYEQLKFDNRNLRDKLEEKDNELIKIREKCQNAMQILAHVREKSDAVDNEINNLAVRLGITEGEYAEVREELNGLKQKRDAYRKGVYQMKNKTGLLAKPKLLTDMENAIAEVNTLSTKVNKCKLEFENTMRVVTRIRKTMESPEELNKLKAKIWTTKADLNINSESTKNSHSQLENPPLIS